MRTLLRWSFLVVVAMVIAAIPTRVASHHVDIGFPFTWRTRQDVVSLDGIPLHSFSCIALVLDLAIVFLALTGIVAMFRRKDKHAA